VCSANANGGGGGGTPAPGGKTATANVGTDVYPRPDGVSKAICSMRPGNTGTFIKTTAGPGEDTWVQLKDITGSCAGKTSPTGEFWIYNDANENTLTIQ
jgi:hypothetical protein